MLLVTGATGFLGRHVIERLVAKGHRPACFVRPSSDISFLSQQGLPLRFGDIGELDSLEQACKDVLTLVNLASLGFGHAPVILEACRRAGVKRGIFISTTAIFTRLEARTKAIRLDAEQRIMASGIEWTIIRPTMIYGSERDRNMARLVRYLARYPIMPVFGSGQGLQQPVHVVDLAAAVVAAMEQPAACGKAYDLSGKSPLTYDEVIDQTAAALGRRVRKVHIPLSLAVVALRVVAGVVRRPGLKAEQVLRLSEDKVFSHQLACLDLGFIPRSFSEGIRDEVAGMRAQGLI